MRASFFLSILVACVVSATLIRVASSTSMTTSAESSREIVMAEVRAVIESINATTSAKPSPEVVLAHGRAAIFQILRCAVRSALR